jgi:hypothetical protein
VLANINVMSGGHAFSDGFLSVAAGIGAGAALAVFLTVKGAARLSPDQFGGPTPQPAAPATVAPVLQR